MEYSKAVRAYQDIQLQAKLPFRSELSELPAKERLNIEVGHLFPNGITDDILDTLIACDGNYSLEQPQASTLGRKTGNHFSSALPFTKCPF